MHPCPPPLHALDLGTLPTPRHAGHVCGVHVWNMDTCVMVFMGVCASQDALAFVEQVVIY